MQFKVFRNSFIIFISLRCKEGCTRHKFNQPSSPCTTALISNRRMNDGNLFRREDGVCRPRSQGVSPRLVLGVASVVFTVALRVVQTELDLHQRFFVVLNHVESLPSHHPAVEVVLCTESGKRLSINSLTCIFHVDGRCSDELLKLQEDERSTRFNAVIVNCRKRTILETLR